MDLGLEKKKSMRYICVCPKSTLCEESTEMIVPDQSPDIMRIINGSADVFLKDKNARDGKVDISGSIKGVVLYIAEGETGVRKLDISIPFAALIECAGVTVDSVLTAKAYLRSLDVREINPRKVAVRANVEILVRAYDESELEVCSGVSDCEKHGICTRKSMRSVYYPAMIREKSFTINDDIELGGVESEMNGILTSSVNLIQTDMKVIGNKAILKGTAEVSYLYERGEGELGCGEYELPFSQIIDIEGMSEENDLDVTLSVSGFELEPQYDAAGKAHYMTASISADACILVLKQEDIELIDDVYSTKLDLDVTQSSAVCKKLRARSEKRVATTESIETGSDIKNVLDVSVSLMPANCRREESGEVLASDAVISVMYVGADDGVYNASRRASVVCPLPLERGHDYRANTAVKGKSFSVGAGNEINVRFFTDFDITDTEEITVPVISKIAADTENVRTGEKTPSVIVRRLSRDCDIWSLAKEYSTTVEEIKIANDIIEDICLTAGRMVLIPKKR